MIDALSFPGLLMIQGKTNLPALLHYCGLEFFFCKLLLIKNFDCWVSGFIKNKISQKCNFLPYRLANCGLPLLFSCHQVWSGDNNRKPRWQTNIGGTRQIKLAGRRIDNSTNTCSKSKSFLLPSPARQPGAADRVLIYCGTQAATSKQCCCI